MSKVYLIDYENIKYFDNIISADEDCEQCLFYTDNCPNISIDVISKFKSIDFIKIDRGNQSLDMCLSSCLGFFISKYPTHEYFIVSNDCDYDSVINFWIKSRNVKISRISKTPEKVEHNAIIMQLLRGSDIPSKTTGEISSIVAQFYCKKNGKQKIYLELIKKYGKSNGCKYYNIIKNNI